MAARWGLLLRIFCLLACLWPALPSNAGRLQNLTPAGLADGAGIWVNMWHYPEGDLNAYCSRLRANGIRNLFIQTSRTNTPALVHPELLGPLVEACHRYSIRVIAWSFDELASPEADAEKLIAAARFQSPHGQRLDGIAGNLEKNLARDRVDKYSKHLREALGATYPMIAVVYSPLNRAPQVAHIPWKMLAEYWDVIAPMTYWGGKYQKLDAYTYTVETIKQIRKLTGRPDLEIHVIGDGMGTTSEQVQNFLQACQAAEATSASLYPNHIPTPEQLASLGRYRDYFPSNARFRLAAFRELTKSEILTSPPHGDPAQPISRADFYRLVARQLFLRNPAGDLTTAQALDILANAGILPETAEGTSVDQALAEPVDSSEALSMIASALEFQSNAQAGTAARAPHARTAPRRRADRWLVQPARAEASQPQPAEPRLVDYLDAAQMVLQARAGLR